MREAERLLAAELDAIDRACSRFRPDSELMRANDAGGRLTPISGLFAAGGGRRAAGRGADRGRRRPHGRARRSSPSATTATSRRWTPTRRDDVRGVPAAGWRTVTLDARRRVLRMSPGCRLDLGATAKALAADRAAPAIAAATGSPTLVDLGGDVATAGPAPPAAGWCA